MHATDAANLHETQRKKTKRHPGLRSATGMLARLCKLALLLGFVALFSGCEVESTLKADIDHRGAGQLQLDARFDPQAAEATGIINWDSTALAEAGWQITGPSSLSNGFVELSASKSVSHVDLWQQAFDEIAGPGIFNNVEISRTQSGDTLKRSFSMTIDTTENWLMLQNDELTERFGGNPFGVPTHQLTNGKGIGEIVDFTLDVSVAANEKSTPNSSSWQIELDGPPTEIELASTHEFTAATLARWMGYSMLSLFLLASVLAVMGVVIERRSERLRRQYARPQRISQRIPKAPEADVQAIAQETAKLKNRQSNRVALVVFDPLTVLYRLGETNSPDLMTDLVALIRSENPTIDANLIIGRFKDLVLGRINEDSFLSSLGLNWSEAGETEALGRRQLRSGARHFLSELQSRDIAIAAISDDALGWSVAMRERDALEAVSTWLISAQYGVSSRDGGMFERLRRTTAVDYPNWLVIDTNTHILNQAKQLGCRTVLFAPQGAPSEAVGHPVVTGFSGFFKRRL